MNTVKVEIQFFEDCPNYKVMRENLKTALSGIEDKTELISTEVTETDTAQRIKFRGSPTLLINGTDIENFPAPENASLSCRYYPKGVPDAEKIRNTILKYLSVKE